MHYGVLKAARSRPVLLTVGLLVALLVVVGLATSGLPGGLVMAGLALLLLGAGAAIVGRARWAFIASRKVATVVAAAGLVAVTVGGVTAPPTAPTSTTSAAATAATSRPSASRAAASPTPTEASIQAAEATLAQVENNETANTAVSEITGLLSDQATNSAVAGAAPTSALAALA